MKKDLKENLQQMMKQRWIMHEEKGKDWPILERDIVRNADFPEFPRVF